MPICDTGLVTSVTQWDVDLVVYGLRAQLRSLVLLWKVEDDRNGKEVHG